MIVRLMVVFGIMILCLGAALWGVDIKAVHAALLQADWRFFAPVFVCYLCAHSVRSLRLWTLLGFPSTYYRMFAINTIGFLAINVVPLRLGEMVRPYLLSER